MMSGLVNASFSVKMIFFAPCVCIACHYQNGINYAKDSSKTPLAQCPREDRKN